jgi:neutral trehalase
MYDPAGWDHDRHQLLMADVGLMSMVIADSDALAKIADTLGKPAEAAELRQRAAKYSTSLGTLWDPSTGIFRNRDLTTGKLSEHLSPTNFYPLLAGTATPDQARRMVAEHLMNPVEFWGPWVIPSIARNDPAFKDQDYWRGRIWGPMNYLVWLGMDKYQIPGVSAERRQLAQKSLALFLKEWHANGHVHENYNGTTGEGDDVTSSDRFYHWGALLGLIGLQEEINTAAAR